MESIQDGELATRYLHGCLESYEALVERYEQKIFNTALNLTNSTESAERVLHQVFVALFSKLQTDLGKTPLFTWLIRYTMDLSVQELLRSSERDDGTIQPVLDKPFSEHEREFESKNQGLRHALFHAARSLPQEQRYVFLLRDILGVSIERIAAMLDMPKFGVRAVLHRARKQLQGELRPMLTKAELALVGN